MFSAGLSLSFPVETVLWSAGDSPSYPTIRRLAYIHHIPQEKFELREVLPTFNRSAWSSNQRQGSTEPSSCFLSQI